LGVGEGWAVKGLEAAWLTRHTARHTPFTTQPKLNPNSTQTKPTPPQLVERELKLPVSVLEGSGKDLEALAVRYASPELFTDTRGAAGRLSGTVNGSGGGGRGWREGSPGSDEGDSSSGGMRGGGFGGGEDPVAAIVRRTGKPLGHPQRMVSGPCKGVVSGGGTELPASTPSCPPPPSILTKHLHNPIWCVCACWLRPSVSACCVSAQPSSLRQLLMATRASCVP